MPTTALPAEAAALIERGGWTTLEGAIPAAACERLRQEAQALYPEGERTDSSEPDPAQERGGNPPRGFTSVVAGPEQGALYHSAELAARVAEIVGAPVAPSAEVGTYSFYERAGDHLGVHRDLEGCDVTVATCLNDTGEPGWECGAVCLWPGRHGQPLAAVRLAPDQGQVLVRLGVGESVVLLGGHVPHAILPVAEGQELLLSLLCFHFEAA